MRRVRSVVLALMLAALLAACAPAAPVPTEVPTLTTTLAPTLTPTLTLVPTATEIPTASPTPTATPRDFSHIEYALTLDEAMKKPLVTTEDILSGLLIEEAKSRAEAWSDSVQPLTVKVEESSPGSEYFNIVPENHDPDNSSTQLMGMYHFYDKYTTSDIVIIVERVRMKNGKDGYLQFWDEAKALYRNNQMLAAFNEQKNFFPNYYNSGIDMNIEFYETYKEAMGNKPTVSMIAAVYYYDKIKPLYDEWVATGIIPEELSLYPLLSVTTNKYNYSSE
jgi:hypothetical protein